jgi:hypothetical protein
MALALARTTGATPQEPPSSLEGRTAFSATLIRGEPANPEFDPSTTRVGAFAEFGLGFRSGYFLEPLACVGYGLLANGEAHLPDGEWGGGGTLEQHLKAWTFSLGVSADVWHFRPRVGFGVALVVQSFEFREQSHSSTEMPLLTQFGLAFNAYETERLRLDVEGLAIFIPGADVNFTTLGVVVRGDIAYFGAHEPN